MLLHVPSSFSVRFNFLVNILQSFSNVYLLNLLHQKLIYLFFSSSDLQIKRPYFHVKPLDRLQLRAWHSYLDWEIAQLNKDTKDPNQGEDIMNILSAVTVTVILWTCVLTLLSTTRSRPDSHRGVRGHSPTSGRIRGCCGCP